MSAVPSSAPDSVVEQRTAQVRIALWIGLASMVLQGMLGIYLNLYGNLTVPSDPNAVFPIIFGNAVLAVHFVNALFLVAISAFLLARAGSTQIPHLRVWSTLLLATFVVASYSGYHFTGTQNNGYSFAMESAFFGALVLVVVLLQRTGELAARARGAGGAGAATPAQ